MEIEQSKQSKTNSKLNFKSTVKELYFNPNQSFPTRKAIGIEIEIEIKNEYDQGIVQNYFINNPEVSNYWIYKHEDSLRNGIEFILKPPLFVTDGFYKKKKSLKKAIDLIYDFICDGPFKTSIRTGIHLHYNVLDYNPIQLINSICNYYAIEPALTFVEGKDRNGNCFCLRYKDTEYILSHIITSLKQGYPLMNIFSTINNNTFKYSSLNLATVKSLGTFEFRFLNSTKDKDRLINWINIFSHLMYNSLHVNTLDTINSLKDVKILEEYLSFFLKPEQILFITKDLSSYEKEEILDICKENLFCIKSHFEKIIELVSKEIVIAFNKEEEIIE